MAYNLNEDEARHTLGHMTESMTNITFFIFEALETYPIRFFLKFPLLEY
jgi:hypothetical protein